MKFSIITACKNRLSHLKTSLPVMLAQPESEVVVVDFTCDEGTADFVSSHYPAARVVSVPDRAYFSNWEARNAGAAAATGEWLVFVDADIILTPDCIRWISDNVEAGAYAKFPPGQQLERHRSATTALSLNNLQGFLVVQKTLFEKTGGYDELLKGWGAGGDVDIQNSLNHLQLKKVLLPEHLIDSIIEHGDDLRFAHTGGSFRRSFIQNLLYRELKRFLLPILGLPIPLDVRRNIYAAAVKAANMARGRLTSARAEVILSRRPVEMRRRLGHPNSEIQISLRALVENLEVPQEGAAAPQSAAAGNPVRAAVQPGPNKPAPKS